MSNSTVPLSTVPISTTRKSVLLASVLLILITSTATAQAQRLTIEKVADGVFAFLPTPDALTAWRAVSNSGAIVLDDGVLVFDSHWTPGHVIEARRLLRQHTDKPIRYVVLSHRHGDHSGGAWALDKEIELISHHATRAGIESDSANLSETLPAQIAGMEQQIESMTDAAQRQRLTNVVSFSRELLERVERGETARLPSLTFDHEVVIQRGRTAKIYFLGRGHTDGDAIVFLPEEKIVFMGDLLFDRTLPNLNNGYSLEWIETLEKVLELGATQFVPGHGKVAGVDAVREQIAYLKWVRNAVKPFVGQEQGLEKALESLELPKQFADYEFAFFFPANVQKVFTEISDGR